MDKFTKECHNSASFENCNSRYCLKKHVICTGVFCADWDDRYRVAHHAQPSNILNLRNSGLEVI